MRKTRSLPLQGEVSAVRPLRAERHSLEDDVYEALVSDLIALRFPPDARLSVDALARDFNVSQTPVRAALIRLESEGLVIKRFNSGYSVAPLPSGTHFRDVYATRLLLEAETAALAARNVNDESLKTLQALCNDMSRLADADGESGYGRFAILDGQFHALISELAGNAVITQTLLRLYSHMNLFRLRYHSTVTSEAVKEHLAILSAIEKRDSDAARAAMAAHITSSCERMEPYYRHLG